MPTIRIEVEGFRCSRCGHEWVPRKEGHPTVCPKCKSPFWDRERRIASFRADAVLEGPTPSAKQLQTLERRLTPRRPALSQAGGRTKIAFDVQAVNESNARIAARRVLSAAVTASGLRAPDLQLEIRSIKPRAD